MLSSCWVQKLPHKQFPETTWWESSALFCWQGLEMPICCSLVGAGKHYLLAEVGRLLNSVIFGFLRKNKTKSPFFVLFHILTWFFFFLRQDLSFYLCFRQTISLHGPGLLSQHCCCKYNLIRKTKTGIKKRKEKNCLFSFLFSLSLYVFFFSSFIIFWGMVSQFPSCPGIHIIDQVIFLVTFCFCSCYLSVNPHFFSLSLSLSLSLSPPSFIYLFICLFVCYV